MAKEKWVYDIGGARWTGPRGQTRFPGEVCWTCCQPIPDDDDKHPAGTCSACAQEPTVAVQSKSKPTKPTIEVVDEVTTSWREQLGVDVRVERVKFGGQTGYRVVNRDGDIVEVVGSISGLRAWGRGARWMREKIGETRRRFRFTRWGLDEGPIGATVEHDGKRYTVTDCYRSEARGVWVLDLSPFGGGEEVRGIPAVDVWVLDRGGETR